MVERWRSNWFFNVRADILSGMVVALALIPEAIAFSLIAGVSPMIGLYASFCIAIIISFVGGRPAMISAATGAMALVLAPLVRDHGLEYMLAATILTGIIQFLLGVFKVARLMKFIPRAVMIGFVNSLAILIFMAQVPYFWGKSSMTYLFLGSTLFILYFVPRFLKSIPAPLIAIVVLTVVSVMTGVHLQTVGDMGTITQTLPAFLFPDVPLTWNTLQIIMPYSFALALVGLLESLLTSSIIDDMTDTNSDKNREARGQGIANFINGFFGGMAGCAMIGQSVINVKSGGRSRLSTLVAGLFLMFLILVLGDLVVLMPMPVLAGIMVMVCIGTFNWSSFSYLKKAPRGDAFVMLVTVIIVVATHDLSKGVIAGVLLSAIFFVAKISKLEVVRQEKDDLHLYHVKGQLFFASTQSFEKAFDTTVQDQHIVIDFTNSHIWDDSGVGAIDKITLKYYENRNEVTLKGLNESSQKMLHKLALFPENTAKSVSS
ncbi:SulP family inorganic anion transporter [Paenibacillus sp. Marseille-Q4541]|uniref:SulP family inorganic anion transporter n=1 Tax=Paenibacillus sp. Marseille-Q4541 TaxID=2831522 RepID=UPI001BADB20F|nr:SulP family inorganic anion transporter [Paenibacillus sp. Marseille-Q4541]